MIEQPSKPSKPRKRRVVRRPAAPPPALPDQTENPQSVSEAVPQSPRPDPGLREQRLRQWDMLDPREKKALGVTFDEFLKSDNYTGYGPNSHWTDPEEVLRG